MTGSAPSIRSVADVLRKVAHEIPAQAAIVVDGVGEMTYGEWDAQSNRIGRLLEHAGLARGDRVGLLFSNESALDYGAAYFGAHKAGGVVVPIGARLAPAEMQHILEHAEARIVLADPRFAGVLKEVAPLATVLSPADAAGEEPTDPGVVGAPEDLADILYTSGTTGIPKGVACSHASVTAIGDPMLKAFAGQQFLHAMPMYTFAGTHGMTFLPLRGRMTALVQPKFDAARFLALVEERRPPIAYIVPAMGRLLCDSPARRNHDTSALKVLIFGAAPMPPSTIEGLAAIFPQTFLVNLYAMTEGGTAACSLPPSEAKSRAGSVGKPVPPTEVRVVTESGTDATPCETGEVWMRSANAPRRSYYRNAEATRATWTADGWLRTGDLGKLDADGYLYLVDRKKDLVIRGGFNVFTAEVDVVLEGHPAVREAAIVGVPHAVLGEDLCAFVVLRDGASATAEELRAHCRTALADYKSPRSFLFVDALPRSPMGKVLKRDLRARYEVLGSAGDVKVAAKDGNP